MLTYIRANAQSFGVKMAFLVIILVFVFWGVGSFNDRNTVNVVAKINSDYILIQEFEQAYRNAEESAMRDTPGITREQLKSMFLGRQVLQELVMQTLVTQEAARAGITVTPLELRQAVGQIKAFQDANGRFDAEAYKRVLAAQRISPAKYEQDMRVSLLREKVYALITAPVWVNPAEAQNRYNFMREKRVVDYIFIPAKDFTAKFTPTDEEIQAYYDSHKDEFATLPKVDVEYVSIDPAAFTGEGNSAADRMHDVLDGLMEDNLLGRPLSESAARFDLKAEQTGLSTQEELTQKLALKPAAATALFAVGAGAPVDTALEAGEKYLTCRILKVEPASTQPIEAVRENIVTALTSEKALRAAMESAAAMPESRKKSARRAPPMDRGGQLADFDPDAELAAAVFAAAPGVWLPAAFAVNSAQEGAGALLCRVDAVTPPDPGEWEEIQGLMLSIVTRERTDGYFRFFAQNLFSRAKIEVINQDVVDRNNM
ncbi:MAG: peptidylprolyl isomerase [Desulfovibrio sp.]|nr:peptidylprolyl isomerase [Desulfovibrio sp.]